MPANARNFQRWRGAGRESLKVAVRLVGVSTSGLRPAPDFLVIGAKRGGTTSFYFDLLEHPSVLRLFPPPMPGLKGLATKGVHYFDSNYFRGDRWYRSYMPSNARRLLARRTHGTRAVAGEASPFYLFHPAAAARAHGAVPEARIIVLLRDPVMRTYSHWKQQQKSGQETLDFAAALDAEPGRIQGERQRLIDDPHYHSHPWEQQSYAAQSRYAESLGPWIDAFGRHRVFVAASESYYAEPDRVLGDVHEFLGIPRLNNASGTKRNAAQGEELQPEVRQLLQERFAEPNRALESLLGQSFPWT